jgi:hypothetical protein
MTETDFAAASAHGVLSRRGFLRASAAAIGGLTLAGCDFGADPTSSADRPTTADTLAGFIELSRVVTGVDELPEAVAPDHLNALEQAALPMAPATLVRIAGYADGLGAATLDELRLRPPRRACVRGCDHRRLVEWDGAYERRRDACRQLPRRARLARPPARQAALDCLGETGAWAKPGRA